MGVQTKGTLYTEWKHTLSAVTVEVSMKLLTTDKLDGPAMPLLATYPKDSVSHRDICIQHVHCHFIDKNEVREPAYTSIN